MSSVNAPNMHSFPPQHLMDFNNDFLLTQIKNQVEFYFAPQNLQIDKFLQSHLNATDHLGAVSINIICSFRKIRQLYSYSRSGYYPHDVDMPADPALLRMALANSSVVSISHDGMWVVPNMQKVDPQKDSATEATVASVPSSPSSSQDGASQQDRSTIILHDVVNTVTEATVLEAFAKFNPKAARSEAGDTWHVVFGSSEDAAASLEEGLQLDDKPIQASLKSDMPNVPAMPLPPPAQQTPNPNAMGYQGHYPMHPPPQQYNYVPVHYGMPPQMVPQYPMQPQYYPQPQYRYFAPPGQQRQGGPPPQNVFVRPTNENNRGMRRKNQGNKRRNNRRQTQQQQQEEKPIRKDTNNKNKNNQEKKEGVKDLDLSKEHFPSLGGKETLKPMSTNIAEGSAYAKAVLKAKTTNQQSDTTVVKETTGEKKESSK